MTRQDKGKLAEMEAKTVSIENQSAEETGIFPKNKEKEAVIYVGPPLMDGTLEQNSVFNNGIPSFLDEHLSRCPAIQTLMVPISRLSETQRKIEVQGSMENIMNAQISAYVRSDI